MVCSPRRLALWAALSLACGACNQSLFDKNVGGDPADSSDGGADDPDAAVGPTSCDPPCQGDPVGDFSLEQGGINGRWFYLADRGDANGAGFDDLVAGTYDGATAWVISDDEGPAIINCADNVAEAVCAGVGDSLVFVPSATVRQSPVLSFRAPVDGAYRVEGQFRSPELLATGVQSFVALSRNARHDSVHVQSFLSSATEEALAVDVEALAGDRIQLTLLPNAADSDEPIAFDFTVTLLGGAGEIFPGRCQFAATFDGPQPLEDKCGNATLDDLFEDPATTVTASGDSVNGLYDQARTFVEGQYLDSTGTAMDYSGDFTIQFWANPTNPQPSFDTIPYSDINTGVPGGVQIVLDLDSPGDSDFRAAYTWNDPGAPDPLNVITGTIPGAGWHFYRFSRDREAGTVSWCIDGAVQGSDAMPAGFDMTSDQTPNIGKASFGTPYFAGSIDDVRIFRRALPCQ